MNSMNKIIVEVVFGIPVKKSFHYSFNADDNLDHSLLVGRRVMVPFGNFQKIGYIIGIANSTTITELKSITKIIDEKPVITEELLTLSKKIADYYFCSLGQAIEMMLSSGMRKGKTSMREMKTKEFARIMTKEEETQHETFILTEEQKNCLDLIKKSITENKNDKFLVHGTTGSGKTEVYIRAVEECINTGKTAIVLVPEISLTPQITERFQVRFPGKLAILHSRLSEGKKFHRWQDISEKRAQIVIGPRSAIFAPLENLGIIIVDEEHDSSYKQEDTPRYNAKDVALMRSEISKCVLILGSATPSLESYYETKKGNIKLIKMEKRIDNRPLPDFEVVNMKQEIEKQKRMVAISDKLRQGMENALQQGQQVMLFLNRRGYATHISCKKCGHVLKCKSCDSVLVYHFSRQELNCHWCNVKHPAPTVCPDCGSSYLKYSGKGTEKIESFINKLFPSYTVQRFDFDSTRLKGTHENILSDFKNGKIKILVGTQMITKGHDFPNVTLVGIISADTSLNIPDFRSGERTFQLITQVSGRAGRGINPGKVIVQTFVPRHYAIKASIDGNFENFFDNEMQARSQLKLPPYMHLIKIMLRGSKNEEVEKKALQLYNAFKKEAMQDKETYVYGPFQSMITKLRGYYRWNILLKTKQVSKTNELIAKVLSFEKAGISRNLVVDVDPITM